jgi:hypothetical protein
LSYHHPQGVLSPHSRHIALHTPPHPAAMSQVKRIDLDEFDEKIKPGFVGE